jgi:hypothetical protein
MVMTTKFCPIDDEAIVEEIFRFDKYEIGIYNKNNTNSIK